MTAATTHITAINVIALLQVVRSAESLTSRGEFSEFTGALVLF